VIEKVQREKSLKSFKRMIGISKKITMNYALKDYLIRKHTIKVQILTSSIGEILSCTKGKQYDFSIFKKSNVLIHPESDCRFRISKFK